MEGSPIVSSISMKNLAKLYLSSLMLAISTINAEAIDFTGNVDGVFYRGNPDTFTATVTGCDKALATLNIPETVSLSLIIGDSEVTHQFEVTQIGEYAFSAYENLTSILLPSTILEIENSAFKSCQNLVHINIPNNTTKIGDSGFYGCSMLKDIELGENITSIGISAFSECDNLENITLPSKLSYLGSGAFYSCDNLNEIILQDNVKYMTKI